MDASDVVGIWAKIYKYQLGSHGMGIATACTEDLAQILAFKRAPMTASFDPQRFAEVREARDTYMSLGDARE